MSESTLPPHASQGSKGELGLGQFMGFNNHLIPGRAEKLLAIAAAGARGQRLQCTLVTTALLTRA